MFQHQNIFATNTPSSASARPPTPAAPARPRARWAPGRLRNAIADAGLKPSDIDGMLSYSGNDSTPRTFMAGDIGARLNFYMDCIGGGSSTEALIGIAIGVMEAGLCKCVAIFRAMNGFSQVRIGGTGARSAAPVNGDALHNRAYGWQSAGPDFRPDLHAAHVRLRHEAGTGGHGEGGAFRARLEQPEGLLQEALHGG